MLVVLGSRLPLYLRRTTSLQWASDKQVKYEFTSISVQTQTLSRQVDVLARCAEIAFRHS